MMVCHVNSSGVQVRLPITRNRCFSSAPHCPGAAGMTAVAAVRQAISMTVQLFLKPDLDQRLIGHIAGIGSNFDGVQQMLGQAQ